MPDFWETANRIDTITSLLERFGKWIVVILVLFVVLASMMWSILWQLPAPVIGLICLFAGLIVFAFLLWMMPPILKRFGIDLAKYDRADRELHDWLTGLMREQSANLHHYINVTVNNIDMIHICDSNPYIDFVFHVHNCSVFVILIGKPTHSGRIKYHISCGESYPQFRDVPVIQNNAVYNNREQQLRLIPNQIHEFTLRQWLTTHAASEIATAKRDVKYFFRDVEVPLELRTDRAIIKIRSLRLPQDVSDKEFRRDSSFRWVAVRLRD